MDKDNAEWPKYIFHGGCLGCTQQKDTRSFDTCRGCQYYEADWDLPNCNNHPSEKLRRDIKAKHLTYVQAEVQA